MIGRAREALNVDGDVDRGWRLGVYVDAEGAWLVHLLSVGLAIWNLRRVHTFGNQPVLIVGFACGSFPGSSVVVSALRAPAATRSREGDEEYAGRSEPQLHGWIL